MARLIAGAAVGQAVRRAGQGGGRGASRPVRRRRMGVGACCTFPAASSPKFPAASRSTRTMCCASSAPRAASRSRISGSPAATRRRHRQDRHHPADGTRDDRGQRRPPALFLRGRCRRRGDPCRASRNSPGPAWAGPTASAISRVLDKWRAAVGLEYEIEKAASRVNTISGRPLRAERHGDRQARHPRPAPDGVGRGARLRGFSHLLVGLDPARRLLRGRRQSVRHRLRLWRRLHRGAARRMADEPRRARAVGDHRQGRALAALLSRRDRQAADAIARPAARPTTSTSISCTATIRTCRSASSSTPWTREVKAGRIRGPFGGSNWTMRAHGRGDRLCRAHRQAEARRALQQFLAGRNAGCRSGRAASPPRPTNGRPG